MNNADYYYIQMNRAVTSSVKPNTHVEGFDIQEDDCIS